MFHGSAIFGILLLAAAALQLNAQDVRTEVPCELCPGGLEDPTLISEYLVNMTCGDFVTTSLFYESDSEMCDSVKMIAALVCG